MKKTVALMAGLALTGSMASIAQEQGSQDYDPNRDIVTDTEQDRGTGMEQTERDTPVQSEYGTESQSQSDTTTDPYGTESQSQTTDPYGTETESQTQTTDPYGTETESQTQTTDPYGTETESQTQTTDPYGTETESQSQTQDPTYGAETGMETGQDVTAMTAEELSGKTIVTDDGEEIGDIGEVGYSSTHQERVATVEVGGFLGVGQKRIAIPLSELQSAEQEGQVKTTMTRDSIESQQEFEESGFTPDQQSQ
ncbi:MAG: PRC-barrel domain-containing protein [Woeseia sp.]